ncbi:MAG: hypothetical protein ACFFD4_34075 [Candidatus Odinarchaeota archaeon]
MSSKTSNSKTSEKLANNTSYPRAGAIRDYLIANREDWTNEVEFFNGLIAELSSIKEKLDSRTNVRQWEKLELKDAVITAADVINRNQFKNSHLARYNFFVSRPKNNWSKKRHVEELENVFSFLKAEINKRLYKLKSIEEKTIIPTIEGIQELYRLGLKRARSFGSARARIIELNINSFLGINSSMSISEIDHLLFNYQLAFPCFKNDYAAFINDDSSDHRVKTIHNARCVFRSWGLNEIVREFNSDLHRACLFDSDFVEINSELVRYADLRKEFLLVKQDMEQRQQHLDLKADDVTRFDIDNNVFFQFKRSNKTQYLRIEYKLITGDLSGEIKNTTGKTFYRKWNEYVQRVQLINSWISENMPVEWKRSNETRTAKNIYKGIYRSFLPVVDSYLIPVELVFQTIDVTANNTKQHFTYVDYTERMALVQQRMQHLDIPLYPNKTKLTLPLVSSVKKIIVKEEDQEEGTTVFKLSTSSGIYSYFTPDMIHILYLLAGLEKEKGESEAESLVRNEILFLFSPHKPLAYKYSNSGYDFVLVSPFFLENLREIFLCPHCEVPLRTVKFLCEIDDGFTCPVCSRYYNDDLKCLGALIR